jgi:CHASE3 domain sensor protein
MTPNDKGSQEHLFLAMLLLIILSLAGFFATLKTEDNSQSNRNDETHLISVKSGSTN